jgi:hypothetical protein
MACGVLLMRQNMLLVLFLTLLVVEALAGQQRRTVSQT